MSVKNIDLVANSSVMKLTVARIILLVNRISLNTWKPMKAENTVNRKQKMARKR